MIRCQVSKCREEGIFACRCSLKLVLCVEHSIEHNSSQGIHDEVILEDEILALTERCFSKLKKFDSVEKKAIKYAESIIQVIIKESLNFRKKIEQELLIRNNAIKNKDLSAIKKFEKTHIFQGDDLSSN